MNIHNLISINVGSRAVNQNIRDARRSGGCGSRAGLPSSSPLVAWSSVAGTEGKELIDACGGYASCLDKIACMPSGLFSDDSISIQIGCVAGRQAMKGEKEYSSCLQAAPSCSFLWAESC